MNNYSFQICINKTFIAKTAFVFSVLMLSFLLMMTLKYMPSGRRAAPADLTYSSYVVREGDSLWSIAQENMTDEFDSCISYVSEIMRANRMSDSLIHPGDLIAIPSDGMNVARQFAFTE